MKIYTVICIKAGNICYLHSFDKIEDAEQYAKSVQSLEGVPCGIFIDELE